MSAVKSKRRQRTPADACAVPAVPTPDHAPALSAEQLRVLHQVYGIILAHSKQAGVA
jgi:hypothetical protein